jgi:hypothetical protein
MIDAIRSKYPDAEIQRFEWSGANRHQKRQIAAAQLAEHINGCASKFPGAKQVLIAHSHGGNVVLYALKNADAYSKVTGSIFLSTPFLIFHRIRANAKDITCGVFAVCTSITILLALGLTKVLSLGPDSIWAKVVMGVSAFTVLFVLYRLTKAVLPSGFGRELKKHENPLEGIAANIESYYSHAIIPEERALVMRLDRDEASNLLSISCLLYAALHKVEMPFYVMVTDVLIALQQGDSKIVSFIRRNAFLIKIILFGSLCTTGSLMTAILAEAPRQLSHVVAYVTAVIVASSVVPVDLIVNVVLLVAAVGAITAIAVVRVLAGLLFLGYGFDGFSMSAFCIGSAESSPKGQFACKLIAAPPTNGLQHSKCYDNPEAIEEIVKRIEQWNN